MEDDKVAIIESQLAQAKQIADEADRKYEEVKSRGDGLNQGCHFLAAQILTRETAQGTHTPQLTFDTFLL